MNPVRNERFVTFIDNKWWTEDISKRLPIL